MSIYTRTGDFGETSLYSGKRVLKCNDSIDCNGLIDELNSFIGLAVSMTTEATTKEFLQEIQKDLCSISALFSGNTESDLFDGEARVKEMEVRIDTMEKNLIPLQQFILPGGTPLASVIHVTRSIARRVERKAVFMFTHDPQHLPLQISQPERIIQYLNRLSDFLFVLARYSNKEENGSERKWSKKRNTV